MNYVKTLNDQVTAMLEGFVELLPQLAIALLIVVLTWAVAKYAVRVATRLVAHTHLRTDLQQLIQTLTRLAVWIIGVMIAMTVAVPSLTPASLFAGLGVGALAIGFAFQDIFENFLAGVLIMIREKMQIGDLIECQGILGKVEKITLRETHIRQLSNELTVVPNSLLFKNPVKILTDQTRRRDEIVVGVSYDTDLDTALAVIQRAVEATEHVDRERPVVVFAREFGASSIDFLVQWWAESTPRDMRATRSDVVRAVKRALDEAGIEIPFPYVTNTFKEALPLAPAKAREAQARDPETV